VALLHGFVCRIGGWRADAGSWHGARGAQEASGRQLEMLPRDGDHRMSCNTVELTGHAAEISEPSPKNHHSASRYVITSFLLLVVSPAPARYTAIRNQE